MDAVAEIKARLPIEELVGSYCQLQQKGRTLKALCPFHNDTRPSLLVSPDKGIAYCFACQKGGDIFSFYQAIENVDFPQALKDLAERAGVTLPKERLQAGPKKDEKDRMRDCLEAATAFYQERLKKSEVALLYLEERKVPPELVKTFRIGFAPDSFDATYTALLKEGFSRKEILGAGLGVQKELKEERIYDRFRNRIMFPITDHQGNLVGFGGRTLGDDAKYINSPDGPLYNKSTALFGLSLAKEEIREKKNAILVEGYFDVLACHRLGIAHVVAVSGTALTEQHVATLKRYAPTVSLLLDSDAAGEAAAERAFLLCKKADLDVRSIVLPMGKDPDECAARDPDAMRKCCETEGAPYLHAVLERLGGSRADKRDILRRLLPLLRSVPSAVEREGYVQKAASILGTSVTALEDDIRTYREAPEAPSSGKNREVQAPFGAVELFLGLLLTYPEHLRMIEKLIPPEREADKALYTSLKASYTPPDPSNAPSVGLRLRVADLSENCRERASLLTLYCEEHFGTWSESMALKELRKLCQKSNRELLLQKQKELIGNIKQARALGKKLEEEQLLTQYQQVLKLSALAV